MKEEKRNTAEKERRLAELLDDEDYDKLLDKLEKWWVYIKDYKKPTESLSQFSLRLGCARDEAFNWKTRGRIPRPEKLIAILDALNVSDEKRKEILNKAIGVPKNNHHEVEKNEGYVYPNRDGVDVGDGRLGFKNIWLETNNIKPESVKLVVCETPAMTPEIKQRDMLLVDMSKTIPQNEKIYLLEVADEPDNQIVCKIFTLPGKKYNITFLNNDVYPNFKVDQEDVIIHGEVVFVGRMI